MTVLTVPADLDVEATLRPVPWRRMAWVVWRQHRVALGGAAAALGALAAYVWVAGVHLHHAHTAATACNPASPACGELINRFNSMNHALVGGYVLQIVPALIGAFVGATVLARELETGTFRYAWTQGFGRARWALAKLVALAIVVTAAAGAITMLLSWYYQPYLATANQALSLNESSPFSSGLFDLRGVAFAAWALAAFVIAGLAGMLIRRVVPALVATLSAYAGLALGAANLLRQHYLMPLVTSDPNVPASAWVISQRWINGGRFAFSGRPPIDLLNRLCPPPGPIDSKLSSSTLAQCLTRHGYTQLTSYQPASRFWTFQLIEGSWLVALSVVLIAATVWLVKRRAV